jgi:replicative DNA helicase
MRGDWVDEGRGDPDVDTSKMTERERELLKEATPFQVRAYGTLDQQTAEAMLVGYLVGNAERPPSPRDTSEPEAIIESGIKKEMFENRDLGELFDNFLSYYRENRKKLTPDEASTICAASGQKTNDASMYRKMAIRCYSTVLIRKIGASLVVEFVINHYLQKQEDKIYQKAVRERADPSVGPQKSWENMRESCLRDLVDPRGGLIKEHDWQGDYKETMSWLIDMKKNPDKYRGYMCGISAIDTKTQGFRDGQLTVFCGPPTGYKSTTMMNISYGLWEAGYDVLYVSLEMEAMIVLLKLWCIAAGVDFTKAYNGKIVTQEDFDQLLDVQTRLARPDMPPEETEALRQKLVQLSALTKSQTKETCDQARMDMARAEMEGKANKLKVINIGQSKKMKLSQLERWLHENSSVFAPKIVVVDYLDLVEPENPNPDRPDIGLGDCCKMLRAMGKNTGYSVITAAQLKRGAMERLRKYGFDTPEKSQLGVDDIAGSHMIGADADNVFMLWREDGGNVLRIFTAKARYGQNDVSKGSSVNIDFMTNKIGDNVETMEHQRATKGMGDACRAAAQAARSKISIPENIDIDLDLFDRSIQKKPMDSGFDPIPDGPELI